MFHLFFPLPGRARFRIKLGTAVHSFFCREWPETGRPPSSLFALRASPAVERGSLQDYIGQKPLNPSINQEKVLQETIKFSIPGTQWAAIGVTTEQFELICRGYVQELYEGAKLTER
jgi:hypothetical protein